MMSREPVRHTTSIAFVGGPLRLATVAASSGFSMAGYLVTSNMLEGLTAVGADISLIVSFFPMPAWPRTYVLIACGGSETLENGLPVVRLGFPNVTPLKQIWLGFSSFFTVLRWGIRHWKDTKRVILCYNLSVPPGCLIWLAVKVTRSRMIGLVYDVDLPGVTVPDSLWHRLDFAQTKALMPHLDGIIAVTEWIGRDFAPKVPSICVPCGISDSLVNRFSSEHQYSHNGRPNVVFAGSLSSANGIGVLLDALAAAPDVNVSVQLIGDGPLLTRARSVSERDARVRVRGRLPYEAVLSAYASADAVVCIRLQETLKTPYLFPSKLVEGMAVGLPLICTIPQNAPLEIQSALRRLAIVVDSEQPESVAAALRVLTSDSMLESSRKARMLRSWAIENLSWHTQCQRMLDFIEQL
jgi:glycosyltransferase involved in cell wall biosynthesis